ncbi:hypothetical protein BAXH7_01040 [Bacillus amyloliquefaciens XH7]|nr:hypothetical protein LL3_01145 [Bacillus amyloliquefaciens LL3]AEK88182.1 hypothetical protein BAXH7_01040 [Bacillus amyloliquefaciens XH7]KYC92754.1 hypothetical protein B425_1087 [Bacillus amyloliquefaciens]
MVRIDKRSPAGSLQTADKPRSFNMREWGLLFGLMLYAHPL